MVWLSSNSVTEDAKVVLTDSLSLVTCLQKGTVLQEWSDWLRQIPAQVTVTYIPGHCGMKYEKANRLAGQTEAFGELIRTPADVVVEVRERVKNEELTGQLELWSTQRLVENGWEFGDGRTITERGWLKKIHNQ